MKLLAFLLSSFVACGSRMPAAAQKTVAGVAIDADRQAVLPFVNIGIRHQNIGTASRADGTFSIGIPAQNEGDTLTFSRVGYEDLALPVREALVHRHFPLRAKPAGLDAVTVTARKLVERKFGIASSSSLLRITDGSTNPDDIFEIAQVVALDTGRAKITSVNLRIDQPRSDSGIFRINFYGFDGRWPTHRLVQKHIVQKKSIQAGWLRFDLADSGIYLKGPVVVALEFIPTGAKSGPIYYEVKLGGRSQSFVRTSSQGDWAVPPHHYRLFVTALATREKGTVRQEDRDEAETAPKKVLFSKAVHDSFSLFVHLPKGLHHGDQKKRLPVLYLLDANIYFDPVSRALDQNHVQAILIGIGYRDFPQMDSLRNRDYLYPQASGRDSLPVSGGAPDFLKFIETELVPYVLQTYPAAAAHQTLMGHSFGGYFVLYTLLEALRSGHNTFRNYVAASPSLTYAGGYLLNQFVGTANTSLPTTDLFVTCGEREDREEGNTGTEGIDHFKALLDALSGNKHRNLILKSTIYPTFGHMETALPTFTQAVQGIH